jgi:hypothetical protein
MSRGTIAAVLIALVIALLAPAAALADGSANCATNGSFYTRMGTGALPDSTPSRATIVEGGMFFHSLNRCNGTDPDGKNGAFVYFELANPSYPDYYFAYDQGTGSRYGDYVRVGYYLCSWSGDTACNQGHGWFWAWGRRAGTGSCATSDANGIHRITGSGLPSLDPTSETYFALAVNGDGSVRVDIYGNDGFYSATLAASLTGCWNRTGTVQGFVKATAWDPGDRIGGTVDDPVRVAWAGSDNTGPFTPICKTLSSGPYRCVSGTDFGDPMLLYTNDR